jgi:hypothetical protein
MVFLRPNSAYPPLLLIGRVGLLLPILLGGLLGRSGKLALEWYISSVFIAYTNILIRSSNISH